MLTTYGEPPAWDAFSKVNANNIAEEDYLSDGELEEIRKKKETALVKAKPMSINGWDPETKTQAILTDEMMQQGAGMGAPYTHLQHNPPDEIECTEYHRYPCMACSRRRKVDVSTVRRAMAQE